MGVSLSAYKTDSINGDSLSGLSQSSRGTEFGPPPVLRGVLHLLAAIIAPFAMWLLLTVSDSPRGYVSAAIFGSCVVMLFGASSLYHFWPKTSVWLRLVRRLDHATIFVFIAGVYTPFALMIFGNAWGIPILSVIWTVAGIGWLVTVGRSSTPRWLRVSLYLTMGWIGLVTIPKLLIGVPWQVFSLVASAGLVYSIGAIIYGRRRPNLLPTYFGYHEFFHLLVVVATGLFYWVIAQYVITP